MQELDRYEYAVVRFVPDIEREEFVNVGVAMMCKRKKWLKVKILLQEEILRTFSPDADLEKLGRQLKSFEEIAIGSRQSGPVALYPVEERFRWLTAVKSTVIQTSRPHPGLTDDLDATFTKIFTALVVR